MVSAGRAPPVSQGVRDISVGPGVEKDSLGFGPAYPAKYFRLAPFAQGGLIFKTSGSENFSGTSLSLKSPDFSS